MKPMTRQVSAPHFNNLVKRVVVADVHRDVLRRRTDEQRLLFGHHLPL